jgi:hypothetical protein
LPKTSSIPGSSDGIVSGGSLEPKYDGNVGGTGLEPKYDMIDPYDVGHGTETKHLKGNINGTFTGTFTGTIDGVRYENFTGILNGFFNGTLSTTNKGIDANISHKSVNWMEGAKVSFIPNLKEDGIDV